MTYGCKKSFKILLLLVINFSVLVKKNWKKNWALSGRCAAKLRFYFLLVLTF